MAKKVSAMVPIYGNLIIKGESTGKTISDVPATIRKDVKAWLVDNGYEELTEE